MDSVPSGASATSQLELADHSGPRRLYGAIALAGALLAVYLRPGASDDQLAHLFLVFSVVCNAVTGALLLAVTRRLTLDRTARAVTSDWRISSISLWKTTWRLRGEVFVACRSWRDYYAHPAGWGIYPGTYDVTIQGPFESIHLERTWRLRRARERAAAIAAFLGVPTREWLGYRREPAA